MLSEIEIDDELYDKLKLKSAETGMGQLELANMYIHDGLINDALKEGKSSPNKHRDFKKPTKLFKHGSPEDDEITKKLIELSKGMDLNSPPSKPMSAEEIYDSLDHDWPEGDWVSKELVKLRGKVEIDPRVFEPMGFEKKDKLSEDDETS